MAKRPIFLPYPDSDAIVLEEDVSFVWHSGMSVAQKRRSIRSFHEAARLQLGLSRILEVSTKSEDALGRRLSAFSLPVLLPDGRSTSVECAFQGSKRFEQGGPFVDLYHVEPRTARKDQRLRASGALVGFVFFEETWSLDPRTAFYDWIYLSALARSGDLAAHVADFQAFTDIEFNPERSVNCQARSVARFASLAARGVLEEALATRSLFVSLYGGQSGLL